MNFRVYFRAAVFHAATLSAAGLLVAVLGGSGSALACDPENPPMPPATMGCFKKAMDVREFPQKICIAKMDVFKASGFSVNVNGKVLKMRTVNWAAKDGMAAVEVDAPFFNEIKHGTCGSGVRSDLRLQMRVNQATGEMVPGSLVPTVVYAYNNDVCHSNWSEDGYLPYAVAP